MADSGYGNEQNYSYLKGDGIDAYVKCNMFHTETKRKHIKNAFLLQNMYYNAERDYYVCPLRERYYRSGADRRTMEVNHRGNSFKRQARELLTSERCLMHRNTRPIERDCKLKCVKKRKQKLLTLQTHFNLQSLFPDRFRILA